MSVFDGGSSAAPVQWGVTPAVETDRTRKLSNRQVLELQQKQMDEQDGLLDVFSQTLDRTKEIALDIGDEVDEQNKLLDDMDKDVTQVNQRLRSATKRIKDVTKKSGSCFLWLIIVFLFLVFLAVLALSASARKSDRTPRAPAPEIVTLAPAFGPDATFNLISPNSYCLLSVPSHLAHHDPLLTATPHCSADQAAVKDTRLSFYRKKVAADPSGSEFYIAQTWQGTEKCLGQHHSRPRLMDCNAESLKFVEKARGANHKGRGAKHVLQVVSIKGSRCLIIKHNKVKIAKCKDNKRSKAQIELVL